MLKNGPKLNKNVEYTPLTYILQYHSSLFLSIYLYLLCYLPCFVHSLYE